jgi:hypothetical protein
MFDGGTYMKTPEQLKGFIRNLAKDKKLKPQEVLQMYLFERIIERLSLSKYKDNFILKGGLLIASMIGVESRSTLDMNTTIRGITIDEDIIRDVINELIQVAVGDGIQFVFYGDGSFCLFTKVGVLLKSLYWEKIEAGKTVHLIKLPYAFYLRIFMDPFIFCKDYSILFTGSGYNNLVSRIIMERLWQNS